MKSSKLLPFVLIFVAALTVAAQSDARRRDSDELKSLASQKDALDDELEKLRTRRAELLRSLVEAPSPAPGVVARRLYACCELEGAIKSGGLQIDELNLPTLDGLQISDLPGRAKWNAAVYPPPIAFKAGALIAETQRFIGVGLFCGARSGGIADIERDGTLLDAIAGVGAEEFIERAGTGGLAVGSTACYRAAEAKPGTAYLLRFLRRGDMEWDGDALYAVEFVRREPGGGVLFYLKLVRDLGKVSDGADYAEQNRVYVRGLSIKLRELLDREGFNDVGFDVSPRGFITLRGRMPKERADAAVALAKRLLLSTFVKSNIEEVAK